MIFVVHALDRPEALDLRLANLDAHRAYLNTAPDNHGLRVLMSGPLLSDDGEKMIGSFFLLDAPDRSAIEAMFSGDPLAKADVWQSRTVNRVNVRQNNVGPLETG